MIQTRKNVRDADRFSSIHVQDTGQGKSIGSDQPENRILKLLDLNFVDRRGMRLALFALFSMFLLAGCSFNQLQPATLSLIADAEATWQASPTANYRITVEVDRPNERRRTIVTVVDGEAIEGFVAYYDFDTRQWLAPMDLNEEQMFAFTVLGLFDMVRGALEGCERDGIHLQMAGEPPFPQKIILGPVIMDGELVEETKSTIAVRQFDRQ